MKQAKAANQPKTRPGLFRADNIFDANPEYGYSNQYFDELTGRLDDSVGRQSQSDRMRDSENTDLQYQRTKRSRRQKYSQNK